MPRKNPSCRWFFDDWHNDEGLALCGLAARGAWIELLGICQANGGYLLLAGKPPSTAALARYVRTSRIAFVRALKELEHNGVFSRDVSGVIYNRRMVRAHDALHTRASDTSILQASINKNNQKKGNGAVPGHRATTGPLRDPTEIAKELGLRK